MPDRESSEENAGDLSQTFFASVHLIVDVVKLLFHVIIIIIESIFRCFIPVPRKSVEGEVVVITGAGHGLGRQLALNFATLGAKVVLLDINQENILAVQQEIKIRGEIAFAFKCDVSIEKQVEELGEKIRREIGNVCILINNAGIMSGKPIMYLHSHQIRKTLEVNILAHFWMIRCFLPELLDSGRGQIVAICSIAGLLGCANLTDYCASKFAVIGLMRALREDLYAEGKEDNIVLTTVCPSTIKTGMVEKPRSRFPSLFPIMDIKTTARIITDGILRNENTIIIPSTSKFAHTIFSLIPLKAAVLLQRFVDYSMDPNIY